MFTYCTEVLRLSEPEAYLRIVAARASRKHPMILPLLAEGRLHLSGIALLAPHLTEQNRHLVLSRATDRSKREIEGLVAALFPRPDVPAVMRKLPRRMEEPRPPQASLTGGDPFGEGDSPARPAIAAASGAPLRPDEVPSRMRPIPAASRPQVEALAPARYKVQFTATAALHDKLERLRALLRSQVPDGDLAAIIEQAVTEKLERLEARRFGLTRTPRKGVENSDTSAGSRHIPAAVRRFVAERDGMRCRYVDENGRRCSERQRLEFHHLHPFGFGGDHRPEGIRLACRAHNLFLAEHDYGREAIARHRRPADRGSGTTTPD
jgi:hypothetical protein